MDDNERYICICHAIENILISKPTSKDHFVIYPFGRNGMLTKNILNNRYNIQECFIIDNKLCLFREDVYNVQFLRNIKADNYIFLITIENPEIYDDVINDIKLIVELTDNLYCIFPKEEKKDVYPSPKTIVGKYSYGPGTDGHLLIESIGAFCSFAAGFDVVPNHPLNYISTHPFMYGGNRYFERECNPPLAYEAFSKRKWYFPGVNPRPLDTPGTHKIIIGNDVWLGKDVIITNSANIGNGVIAGAGSVITKDVPDYAIVAGAPAKIVRYRINPELIDAMNEIAWWNWSDEKIRANYEDFFLSAEAFVRKHHKLRGE